MRLHKLEMTAFGPFAGRQDVDFDALGTDGLFLLHGDTGAGKTTVLDAIAYALFGSVPGARGEVKRLRSDLADAETATEVSLEFTVSAGDGGHPARLRVTRSPEYERPKRRGDGTTRQPAKAVLTWLSGGPAEPVIRIDEVARSVERLVGLTAEQFFQVVLLPQGEFARFLRAATAEREQLLEKLFGTQRFDAVQDWFSERRRRARSGLDVMRASLREWAARFAQAAGAEPVDTDVLDWAHELRSDAIVAAERAEKDESAARETSRAAEALVVERRALLEKVRRVRGAHEKLRVLDERAAQLADLRAELADARRAEPVVTAHEAVRRMAVEVDDLRAVAQRAADAVDVDAEGDPAALRARAGDLREEAGALAGLVAEAAQQAADERRIDVLAVEAARARELAAGCAGDLAALPERIADARARVTDAVSAAGRLDGATRASDEVAAQLAAARELPDAELAASRAAETLTGAVDAHQNARDQLLRLRELRLAGMAAELAGSLRPGAGCPVCGSAEHPAPAAAADGAVDETQERAAADAETVAQEARHVAAAARQEADAALAALRERVAGRSASDLAQALTAARAEVARLAELAEGRGEREAELGRLEETGRRLTAQQAQAERTVAAADAERASLAAAVAERRGRLDAARGEYPGPGERRTALLATAAALESLATVRAELRAAEQRLTGLRETVSEEIRTAGFADESAALAAARESAAVAAIEAELGEAEVAARAARAVLEDPELEGIAPDADADVADALATAAAARAAADEALVAVQSTASRAAQLQALEERLQQLCDRLAPAERAFAELDALTDVLNGRGQNHRKISLRSYVLAARLEEVAIAATARLRTISQGRFSFVHSDAAGARGTRGGLGLDVLDDYSGHVRSAKTLSGGESFLASLALALGLADVVAAEAGGTQLDTLFIDEGFGALDAETLDVVMDTLDGLRAGGRVVGVVSHVDEMRQRIPTRLHVRKARTGSVLELQS